MKTSRMLAIVFLSLGMGMLSLALGYIYVDFTNREGAWVDLTTRREEPTQAEREQILDAWRTRDNWQISLVSGTLAVTMLGAGVGIVIFELPWFQTKRAGPEPQDA
jgi:hypothetical protein